MEIYCPHEGLCLHLSIQDARITDIEFCSRMDITRSQLQELTNCKRLDQETKERAAIALGLSLSEVFNNRVQRVWSLHLTFSRDQLENYIDSQN